MNEIPAVSATYGLHKAGQLQPMTTIKTLISTVALITASTVFAQSSNTCSWFPRGDETGQGIIGKRYADAGFSVESVRHTAHSIGGASLAANLPVTKHIDISGGYDYMWLNVPAYGWSYNNGSGSSVQRIDDIKYHNHRASGSITFYNVIEDGVKPFVSVGLDRSWADSSGPWGNFAAETRNGWNVVAGAEFPCKWVAVTPQIAYQDDFKASSISYQSWSFGLEVSAWVTSRIGVYVNTSFNNILHTSDDNWVTGAGVRCRF
jgi:hypothetical protein